MQKHHQGLSKAELRIQSLDKIDQLCVVEAQQLLKSGYSTQALTSAVLGMEWVGAVLDGKPYGAKNQSRKRFQLTLGYFPKSYHHAQDTIDLYKQLRNRTVHNPWVIAKYLVFTENPQEHMTTNNGVCSVCIAELIIDLGNVISDTKNRLVKLS